MMLFSFRKDGTNIAYMELPLQFQETEAIFLHAKSKSFVNVV